MGIPKLTFSHVPLWILSALLCANASKGKVLGSLLWVSLLLGVLVPQFLAAWLSTPSALEIVKSLAGVSVLPSWPLPGFLAKATREIREESAGSCLWLSSLQDLDFSCTDHLNDSSLNDHIFIF